MSGCKACLKIKTEDCPYHPDYVGDVSSESIDTLSGCEEYIDEEMFKFQHVGVDKEFLEAIRGGTK